MFEIEHEIAAWRRQMLAAGIMTPVPLDELESHLRDEVEQQVRAGVNAQEAFETAVQRIGHARALKVEFKKVGATERTKMKRIVAILAALLSMIFGLSIVLPELGQWSRIGVVRSPAFLLFGVALVIVGGSVTFYAIKTHRVARGRKLISVGLIAVCGFYAIPFLLTFFQSRDAELTDWIFCGGLTAAAILFFGMCFCFNRALPAQPVHET